MDDLKTDSLVREHYEQHALPQERVARLEQMIRPRRRDVWRFVSLLATAACLVLAVMLVTVVAGRPTDPTHSIKTVHANIPRIVAVQFHADWCKPSRTISPRVDQLGQRYGDEGVLFVEVDLTTDKTRNQAGYLMAALGLESVWMQQNGRTGELLLIDRADGAVLSTFDQGHDLPLRAAAFDGVLNPG